MKERTYIAIDLKNFYASVECRERGLDPMDTNLVVADESHTDIEAIKAYRPSSNSLGSGQVLHQPYEAEKAKLVLREMADLLVLDLVDKGLVTDQIVVTVGYDIENLTDPERRKNIKGLL